MIRKRSIFAVFILVTFGILGAGAFLPSPFDFLIAKSYAAAPAPTQTAAPLPSPSPSAEKGSIFSEIFATEASSAVPGENWYGIILKVIARLLLSVVLSAALAFRPRRDVPLLQRNIYVSQTQILLAVVGAALMMIVGDSAARAFAIFAAVSLVRFRTNIRDPKEITVLLISLALGLAAGVGRWDLGVVLCVFSVILLWILEYNEPERVYRSMELTIKTRNPDKTQEVIKRIFRKYKIEAEVREIDPPDEKNQVGSVSYYLNLPLNISTDRLNDRILALDKIDIEGVEWQQKKNGASVYQ
jgi:uncharacterized membrane protein YhiD involved in acid resistance